jgi:hypothetical protein
MLVAIWNYWSINRSLVTMEGMLAAMPGASAIETLANLAENPLTERDWM